jgi:hypothetical protein
LSLRVAKEKAGTSKTYGKDTLSHHALKSVDGPDSRTVSNQDNLLAVLHQTIGNQGLQRILRSGLESSPITVHKKLKVDSARDDSEIEADDIARFIAEISPSDRNSGVVLKNSDVVREDKVIQRKESSVIRKNNNNNNLDGSESPSGLLDVLENDQGSQLESPIRTSMDRRFGHDFSDVRIHTSSLSSAAADSLNARAFTMGNDVFFGRGMYNPSSKRGEFLLAHELTHVIQQRPPSQDSSQVNPIKVEKNERHELDAHAAASAVTQSQPMIRGLSTQSAPYSIQGAWYDTPLDWAGSAVESVGEAAGYVGEGIVSGAKAVGGAVKEGAVYVGEGIVSGAKAVGGAVKEGAVYVGEGIVSGAKAIGRGAKAAGEFLYDAGVAVAHAFGLLARLALNPLAIPFVIAGIAWDYIPEGIKTVIINKILDAAIAVLNFIPDMPQISFLWPFLKHSMIGFLGRARSYEDDVKLHIANRFGKLASSAGSADFILGYFVGLLHGLWDGISGPFILLWDIIKLGGRLIVFLKNLAVSAFKTAMDAEKRNKFLSGLEDFSNTLNENIDEAIDQLFSGKIEPMKIIHFIIDIYHAALKGAKNIGASISDALLKFLRLPDYQLGHGLGRVAGNILFEVALIILTSGAYLAKPAVQRVTQLVSKALIRTAEFVTELLEHLPTIVRGFNALREFAVSNRAMRRIIDGAERLFNLLLDFLKASFGIGSAEKRAAAAAEIHIAEEIGKIHKLPKGHELTHLGDGLYSLCSCPIDKKYMRRVYLSPEDVKLLNGPDAEGSRLLRESLAEAAEKSERLGARYIDDYTRDLIEKHGFKIDEATGRGARQIGQGLEEIERVEGMWVFMRNKKEVATEFDTIASHFLAEKVGTGKFFNSHHGIKGEWARAMGLEKHGYVYKDAPTILLRDRFGHSPHGIIGDRQKVRGVSHTYKAERDFLIGDLMLAGASDAKIGAQLAENDKLFKKILDHMRQSPGVSKSDIERVFGSESDIEKIFGK